MTRSATSTVSTSSLSLQCSDRFGAIALPRSTRRCLAKHVLLRVWPLGFITYKFAEGLVKKSVDLVSIDARISCTRNRILDLNLQRQSFECNPGSTRNDGCRFTIT